MCPKRLDVGKVLAIAAMVTLAACGGGSTPPVLPLSSSVSPPSGSTQVVEGNSGQLAFTVSVSAGAGGPAVPMLTLDSSVVALQGSVDTSVANQYGVRLATVTGLAPGAYSGQVTFRLCSDMSCATVYAGSTQTFTYTVTVSLAEWETFQRNAAHTGFVDVALDPAAFKLAWTWSRPAGDPEPIGGVNAVASGAGNVYITKDVYFGQGAVYALSEVDGALAWSYDLGRMASEGPAAFSNDNVYVTSTDPAANCVTWALDAAGGTYKFRMQTQCQWSSFFASTVSSGAVLDAAQGGSVYSFSAADGSLQWSVAAGSYDQSTPAADANYVYQYGSSGGSPALNVFDRKTGASIASIADPFAISFSGYSMFSAPMLGAAGEAIAFSNNSFSGRAASSSEQFDSRVLVSYDIAKKAYAWRAASAYLTHPAIANGVVYAARNAPAALDALSEADGHVLWSWPIPAGDTSFHRNVVVTRNLVFVSTDTSVYAIDLNTRQSVWSYPNPGMLAISALPNLYIATGATISDGNLVAIKLR